MLNVRPAFITNDNLSALVYNTKSRSIIAVPYLDSCFKGRIWLARNQP